MKTHNTTTTPRDRVINAITRAPDAPAARRAIGELVIREPDASVRVRISRLGDDVGRKLDHMNHIEFIDYRGSLAVGTPEVAREALEAFGLAETLDPGTGPEWARERLAPNEERLADRIADKVAERMPRPGVPTFKGEDLEALQRLLGVYCSPDRAQARGDLARSWAALDHALEGLADAYTRATA